MSDDTLALPVDTRAADAYLVFALLCSAALLGWLVHPAVGLAFVAIAVTLVAVDWSVSGPALIAGFAAIVMLIPADIRLKVPLPIDGTADRLVVLLLFAAWTFGLLATAEARPSAASRKTSGLLKGVLAFAFASLVVNAPRTIAGGFFLSDVKSLVVLLTLAGTFFLTLAVVSGRDGVDRVVRVLVVTGTVAAISGVAERWTQSNPIRSTLLSLPLLSASRAADALTRGNDLRVMGTGEHAIAFGGAMAMLLPFALYLALNAEGRARVAWAAATVLIALAMLFSVSRSALIASVAVMAVLLVVWPRWRTLLVGGAVVGAFALHMLVPGLLGTFRATLQPSYVVQQESAPDQSNRFTDYPKVAAIIPQQPLFGLGYASFDPHRYFYLDNQLLKTVLELGVAGSLLILLFAGSAGLTLVRAIRAGPRDATSVEGAVLASMVGFAVMSAFFDTFGFAQVTYLFFILTALGLRAAESRDLRLGKREVSWAGS